ncbi:hypothetical protein CERZMDRAFT_96231 [Cercospora zeae-maydis SCOH1-5]|uniref:BTB domain-containing protein n=1 Tax=Cercospora zeae-maydis SCOH1-5 TaxID=717836 RepID=A0A6A6FIU5_9PEZI|nr:hypothetical protein CERZMDRAFT_96231 [Cercospora zeae-maydis SCOH1-5]
MKRSTTTLKGKRLQTAKWTAASLPSYTASSDCSEDEFGPKVAGTNTLSRMYETGDWSDLTVEAIDGKVFKVHKSVVCPASPYFNTACTSGFLETHTNRVSLPESAKIVDAILRHFYETPAPWTEKVFYGKTSALPTTSEGNDLMELRVAIDKYGIASLVGDVEDAFAALLQYHQRHHDYKAVTLLGRKIFDAEGDFWFKMRLGVASATASFVPDILKDNDSFEGSIIQHNSCYSIPKATVTSTRTATSTVYKGTTVYAGKTTTSTRLQTVFTTSTVTAQRTTTTTFYPIASSTSVQSYGFRVLASPEAGSAMVGKWMITPANNHKDKYDHDDFDEFQASFAVFNASSFRDGTVMGFSGDNIVTLEDLPPTAGGDP